jgi:sepiapterin reductase
MNSPVILITGAGKGIGEALVQRILSVQKELPALLSRPRLVLTSRTKDDLDRLSKLCAEAKVECATLPLELVDQPTLPVKTAIEKFGRLDVVLHSAGVGRFGNFLDLTKDDLDFVMKTNVEASFLFMQTVYRQMKQQKSGFIQWVTSVAAERPFEQSSIYCMSKYAQKGLIDVMRMYGYRDGIHLTEVKPGATLTPMWGEVTPEMRARMMQAEDVAKIMIDALLVAPRASVEEILIRPLQGDL